MKVDTEIFAQGDVADAAYFLLEGIVKISVTLPNGRQAVLAIHGPGNFFGDGFLTGRDRRRVTAAAVEPASVVRIEAAAMRRLLRNEPDFSEHFVAYLIDRKIRTEFSLTGHLVYSSEQRLALALLELAELNKNNRPKTAGLKIRQETLADMIGTTRSRVSYFMNKFRRLGFIEYKDEVRVYPTRLKTVLGDG